MSSRHNYTNPAFCQQSEFYPTAATTAKQQKQLSQLNLDRSLISINEDNNNDCPNISSVGVRRIQRSVSTRSFNTSASYRKTNAINRSQQHLEFRTPPKPGPKPNLNRSVATTNNAFEAQRSGSGRYALVPVEELTHASKDRYAIVPGTSTSNEKNLTYNNSIKRTKSYRLAKSQENIDRYSHVPTKNEQSSFHEESDTFTSLPPMPINEDQPRLKAAFSSDFGSKSFVLVDQKNNQRYAVVPTADDEDIVDENHEIIQMHNGRAHRYAVIPTEEEEDEDETCLSTSDLNQSHNYSIIPEANRHSFQTSTPQKTNSNYQQQQHTPQHLSYPTTPMKNPIATRKLHELLSTPRKTPGLRSSNVTPPSSNGNIKTISRRYQSQQQIYIHGSRNNVNQTNRQDLSPQRLQYEQKPSKQQNQQKSSGYLEARTTAVITPRVAHSSNHLDDDGGDDDDDNSFNKSSYTESYPQKVANATATLGVISLMLTLSSALNSGLCLYLIANTGRSFYLEFGLASAFAGIGLGILGFRSRHCEWLPNRSYISGYILVTVFCLLKCCGLLVLLALDPFPGMPLHDVTTGIVLGLSTFEVFFIGLGVIGSYWCYRPPPDNRVNVY